MGIEPTLDLIDPTTALKTAGNTSHQSPPHEVAVYSSQTCLLGLCCLWNIIRGNPPNASFCLQSAIIYWKIHIMKRGYINIIMGLLICSTSIVYTAFAAEPEVQTIQMEVYEDSNVSDLTGYGNCQWLYPLETPKEKLEGLAEFKSDKPYYYAAVYGDGQDNTFSLVIDESGGSGTGYNVLYVDSNNNNRIDKTGEKHDFSMSGLTTADSFPLRVRLDVSAGDRIIPYYFAFTAFNYTDEKNPDSKVHANARNSSIMTGKADFDGKTYKIALADLNSNGLYNDTELGLFRGDRLFVDFNGDGKFKRDEKFPYGKYTKILGKWYSITARPGGMNLKIAHAKPQLGTVKGFDYVKSLTLRSPEQSQTLDMEAEKPEAIAGKFKMAAVRLQISGEKPNDTWYAEGSYPDKPEIVIPAGGEYKMQRILPLQVSITPSRKDSDTQETVIELTLDIKGCDGSVFRCPRLARPVSAFEILDSSGKVVASEKFEYG